MFVWWGCRLGFIAKPRLGLSESYRRVIGDLSRCYRNAPGGSPNPRLSPLGGRNGARIARTIADIAAENAWAGLAHLLFLAWCPAPHLWDLQERVLR